MQVANRLASCSSPPPSGESRGSLVHPVARGQEAVIPQRTSRQRCTKSKYIEVLVPRSIEGIATGSGARRLLSISLSCMVVSWPSSTSRRESSRRHRFNSHPVHPVLRGTGGVHTSNTLTAAERHTGCKLQVASCKSTCVLQLLLWRVQRESRESKTCKLQVDLRLAAHPPLWGV